MRKYLKSITLHSNVITLTSKNNKLTDVIFCYSVLQFNFVGRILGPRGMTAKQLEQETGCKIMVRGKGSMRDKKKVKYTIYLLKTTIFFSRSIIITK